MNRFGATACSVAGSILLLAAVPRPEAASDVIEPCGFCPVGRSEVARLSSWFRSGDLVVEATCVAFGTPLDSLRSEFEPIGDRFRLRAARLPRNAGP